MRNLNELDVDMDSLGVEQSKARLGVYDNAATMMGNFSRKVPVRFSEQLKRVRRERDSIELVTTTNQTTVRLSQSDRMTNNFGISENSLDSARTARAGRVAKWDSVSTARLDSLFGIQTRSTELAGALAMARAVKTQIQQSIDGLNNNGYEYRVFHIQWHKIWANSFSCLIMFLIGAPLGAIIKKGGLGVPVLASIIFFIIFYVLSIIGEKWAKQELVSVPAGIWAANSILFVVGILFLLQARRDARLFESDFYKVMVDRLRRRFGTSKPGF